MLDDRILLREAEAALGARGDGPAWAPAASLQAVFNTAISQGKSIFILPGTILTGAITVTPLTGTRRLIVQAEPGSVVVKLRAPAPHLLRAQGGFSELVLRGLIFDGAGQAIEENTPVAGLVRFDGANGQEQALEQCEIRNSLRAGLGLSNNARVSLRYCRIKNCDTGAWSLDSQLIAENNRVSDCANNGVLVWRSAAGRDQSIVRGNEIESIDNKRIGTGEFGNGVGVFRAGGVRIENNRISTCRFSAIRVNGGSQALISGNACREIREVAIFVEAPTAGLDTGHVIVTGNMVDGAGVGIAAVNAGLFRDGTTRGVVINANQVLNIRANAIAAGGYSPPHTIGVGILCETETSVIGNFIDGTAGPGIVLGTNPAARKLVASGNIVRNAKLGIGFSADNAAKDIVISANVVSGYRNAAPGGADYPLSGAIVPVSFNGAVYARTPGNAADYGNADDARIGALAISGNRASP